RWACCTSTRSTCPTTSCRVSTRSSTVSSTSPATTKVRPTWSRPTPRGWCPTTNGSRWTTRTSARPWPTRSTSTRSLKARTPTWSNPLTRPVCSPPGTTTSTTNWAQRKDSPTTPTGRPRSREKPHAPRDHYSHHELVAEEGFSSDPDEAVAILEEADYLDEDGDGYVETPDGDEISLTLEVPSGWTDWMESSRVIAENAQEVGINIEAQFPDEQLLTEQRNS